MSGRFIVFEGGEGAGKSTQARLLTDALEARGLSVVLTREPGGTPGAEAIRSLLLHPPHEGWGPQAEALLFAAARADHVAKLITPALAEGKWVICDRFIDSTRVYQGTLGNVDERLIRSLERVTVGPAVPELTFILDVPAQVGMARAKNTRGQVQADRFEAESMEFHEKLRGAYRALAAAEPKRCIVIDGRAPRDVVADRIWSIVQERLHPQQLGIAERSAP